MNPNYPMVAQRAAHHCEYCQAPEAIFNFAFEVEHVIPVIRGGVDGESNWALACRSCNLHKSVHIEHFDPESGTTVKLFHPRQERWLDHFGVETGTGTIFGRTASGRATVVCLRMNSVVQLAARRHWMRLHLFPTL